MLLNTIQLSLLQRQQECQQSATNPAQLHTAHSYMDDTSILLHHQDIQWYLSQLQQHGPDYGIFLNLQKTKLLADIHDTLVPAFQQ